MGLQVVLAADYAPSQRVSSNRISAADNEYTEGQVMLTGAKLRQLVGPRSMATRPSRQCPGSRPSAPPWSAPGGSGRFHTPAGGRGGGSSVIGRPTKVADPTAFGLQERGWQRCCSRSTAAAPLRPRRCRACGAAVLSTRRLPVGRAPLMASNTSHAHLADSSFSSCVNAMSACSTSTPASEVRACHALPVLSRLFTLCEMRVSRSPSLLRRNKRNASTVP